MMHDMIPEEGISSQSSPGNLDAEFWELGNLCLKSDKSDTKGRIHRLKDTTDTQCPCYNLETLKQFIDLVKHFHIPEDRL